MLGNQQSFGHFGRILAHDEYAHLRNTYTNKLRIKPREGIFHKEGRLGWMAAIWHPIPSVFDKGRGKEKGGGTIQARITGRKPPVQTLPKPVENCLRSRFPAGTLRSYDFSQIELRTAALLSGCPVLMKVYQTNGKSIHLDTLYMLYPDWVNMDVKEAKTKREYVMAKSLNFLVLYRGGAGAFQATARSDCGLDVDIETAANHIRTWYAAHPAFKAWQDRLIETVSLQGFLELPTGWSRSFGKGRANAMGAVNEICNFPIQTIGSGQIPLSAQFAMLCEFKRRKMKAVICCNNYDSITVDTPYSETAAVDEIGDRILPHPPIMKLLEDKLGRTIPIEYERKVV